MAKNDEFAARFARLLRERGYWDEAEQRYDLTRLGRDTGITYTYFYDWLEGTVPSTAYFLTLTEFFRVSARWLLDGDDAPRPTWARPVRKLLAVATLGAGLFGLMSPSGAATRHPLDLGLPREDAGQTAPYRNLRRWIWGLWPSRTTMTPDLGLLMA